MKTNKKAPSNYYQEGVKNNFMQRFWHLNKLKIIIGLIENKNPHAILEVGCASGWLLNQVRKHFPLATYKGIDIDSSFISYGNKLYPQLNLMVANAHKLPFPSKTFNIIICAEVLEHLEKPEQVLREINRVLKQDGYLILEIDTNNWLFRVVWSIWTRFRGKVWRGTHLQNLTIQELEEMFDRTGFKVKKKKIFNLSMAIAFQLTKV